MSEKKAYTPAEFAALFGKEKTWAYRLLYAGKVTGITEYGRTMISAEEADRIAGEGKRYVTKKKVGKERGAEALKEESEPPKKRARWSKWIDGRKGRAVRSKGMGSKAKKVDD